MDEKKNKKKTAPTEEAQQESEIKLTMEQFEEVKARIDELQKERDEYLATAQRLQAEFDNYRKRNAALRSESFDDGAREVAKELLPVLDNLERAIDSLSDEAKEDGFAQGVIMVHKQLFDALAKLGMEHIDTDCAFDPELHDAVLMVEKEGVESGMIADVVQKGYMFKGKPLRCSMVQVAK